MFFPEEIIFAATDACNLHCNHCFVSRSPNRLDPNAAIAFIESCGKYNETVPEENQKGHISKIGFSGGEPFLYMDFIEQIVKCAIDHDMMFDQIMTNGDWWKDEKHLVETLTRLYDCGYDGKIGVSWDSFHNQTKERIDTFINTVEEIFGEGSVNIQRVINPESKSLKAFTPESKTAHIYDLPQTFQSEDKRAWKSFKWFKDDFCQGPGNILFIHPSGNIAPCCGFANENKELYIGTINDSFETVLQKSEKNKLISICYETGLGEYRKQLKKQGIKFPGKTQDICSFCDFVCKNRL